MQKGMFYPWLADWTLRAAIALPAMGLMWLTWPVKATEIASETAIKVSVPKLVKQPVTEAQWAGGGTAPLSPDPAMLPMVLGQATSPESTESSDPDEDETFSPLPEADAVEDMESQPSPETPEAGTGSPGDEPEAADEGTTDDAPSAAEVPPPSIPIPAETVLDSLDYLDPAPNPLVIQTQPEEVEIIAEQILTLEEVIELAYRNNPDLQTALLELEQSQAALREAQATRFPTVTVNGFLQGQNTTSSTFVPGSGPSLGSVATDESLGAVGSAQIDATYNVFSSGGRSASIKAAEEQVRFSELEVERRREELRINTANEYYDLQEAIEAIRINQAFLNEAERNLRDTTLREEQGVGTQFDVLRAEVQVANARQDLVNAQASREIAQRTLTARLNVPPSVTIKTAPVSVPPLEISIDDVVEKWPLTLEASIVLAYQNRAELEQQLAQRDISEQLRRQELSVLGPQVDLFANYLISDTLTTTDSFNDTYQVGVQVSMALFEGGAARARARQQELNANIAERNFEETRNGVRLAVENAYYALQSNFTNIDTARVAVNQAQRALDLANLRFDAGVGTQLDILNAQSELTDAEVNLVQALVGYNRSLAELERAVSNIPEPSYRELPY